MLPEMWPMSEGVGECLGWDRLQAMGRHWSYEKGGCINDFNHSIRDNAITPVLENNNYMMADTSL